MTLTKLIIALIAISAIVGCSSSPKKDAPTEVIRDSITVRTDDAATVLATASFAKQNGKVNIVFDSKGNWESISSVATGGISASTYEAQEQATTIATMRAKRNIAEFLSTDVSSTKTLVVVSRTLQKAKETKDNQTGGQLVSLNESETDKVDQDLKDTSKQVNLDRNSFTIANTVREQISESSNAILKGLQVVAQGVSPDGRSMQVEIRIVKKHIGLANAIKIEMQ
jgi:hypothetical protein